MKIILIALIPLAIGIVMACFSNGIVSNIGMGFIVVAGFIWAWGFWSSIHASKKDVDEECNKRGLP